MDFLSFLDSSGKELDVKRIDELENVFRNKIFGSSESRQTYLILKDFFLNFPGGEKTFYFSYWRWFVVLSWSRLPELTTEEVVSVLNRQVVTAIKLDIDPLLQLYFYFKNALPFFDDRLSAYSKIKTGFINADCNLGQNDDEKIRLKDKILEMKKIKNLGFDSLHVADYKTSLKKIIFPKENNEYFKFYYVDNKDGAVERLFNLVDFFLEVDEEDIWMVVERYMQEQIFSLNESEIITQKETQNKLALVNSHLSNKHESTKDKTKVAVDLAVSKNSAGDYSDVQKVFEKLENLAREYNDPSITEMYYYDEAEGKFKWKEE